MKNVSEVLKRLIARSVLQPNGCREWQGCTTHNGYGTLKVEGGMLRAHRAMFFAQHGWWPEVVRHTCDNPSCVSPFHLRGGTTQDNVNDKMTRGRFIPVAGERNGYATLTEAKVLDMRAMYATGDYTQQQLGDLFGVARSQVSQVVRRIAWGHI